MEIEINCFLRQFAFFITLTQFWDNSYISIKFNAIGDVDNYCVHILIIVLYLCKWQYDHPLIISLTNDNLYGFCLPNKNRKKTIKYNLKSFMK